MNHRLPIVLALGASSAVPACFIEKLNAGAASGGGGTPMETPDGGSGAPFAVNLMTPPIGLQANAAGEITATAASACDKVVSDAHDIRQRICARCHEGPSAQGAPLTFILEDDMIINGKSTSTNNAGKTYIIPGDPDDSLIYRRAAIIQDMPPGTTDVPT